jgi:hypothetical protein
MFHLYATVQPIGDTVTAIGFVAFHYPRSEHFEDFIGRAHQVGRASRSSAGRLSVEVRVFDERDRKPREISTLLSR